MPSAQPPETNLEARAYRISTGVLSILAVALISLTASAYASDTQHAVVAQKEAQAAAVESAARRALAQIQVLAHGAIVVDTTAGTTLYEKNADAQLPLASLTKVPLALAVKDVLPRESLVTLPTSATPGSIGDILPKGTRWSVQDLMDYTLVASSNDGAEALAEAADEPLRVMYPEATPGKAALWRMNDIARSLGLAHTFFLNVSGLDESPTLSGAYGSARDVASLFSYASLTAPAIFTKTGESQITITDTNNEIAHVTNTNDALPAMSGLVMGKTGYTDLAGGNLAVVFDVAGHRITAVVLGSTREGRFVDMTALVAATGAALAQ